MLSKRCIIGMLIYLLVLTSTMSCVFFSSSLVQAQPVRHTYTFPNADESNISFSVTVDTSILTEGGIGSWSLMITASPDPSAGVKNLTLRGTGNGSSVSRSFLVPTQDAFSSDKAFNFTLIGQLPSFSPIYVSELLVVWQDTAGLPASFSFDLLVTVTYSDGSVKNVHLKSDEAVISFIVPNPSKLPLEARNFMVACYLSSFLLPLGVVIVNKLVKKRLNRRVNG